MTTTILQSTAISGTTPISSPWIPHGAGPLSLQLATDQTVAGAWKIEASNKPGLDANGSDANASDITAGLQAVATGAAPALAAGAPTSQFVQVQFLKAGSVRVTFTPSSGAGNVIAHGCLP
jgi:hypothetical protein